MQIKLFYKTLPTDQDPAPLIAELEREVNEWLKGLDEMTEITTQTAFSPPHPIMGDTDNGSLFITVTYGKYPGLPPQE
jgi:hypothetical protein